MSFITKRNAVLFLLFNSSLWGSSYVWSKMLLQYMPRFSILCVCSLGSLITTAVIFHRHLRSIRINAVIPSVIASAFSILSNTFCMLALENTSSSNTAFIVQASIIITPVIMAVIAGKIPEGNIAVSSLTAMAGIFLLTCDFTDLRFNPGDLFALANALFFSLHLVSVKLNSKRVDPVHFALLHHLVNSVAFFAMAFVLERRDIVMQSLKTPAFALLITASTIVSALTVLFQSTALKYVRPERAALVYAFEPVAASILAFAIIGERMNGVLPYVGCLLILASVLYAVCRPVIRRRLSTTILASMPKNGLEINNNYTM